MYSEELMNKLRQLHKCTQDINHDLASEIGTANVISPYDFRYQPNCKAGTVIWAFAYQFHSTKEGMLLLQAPVKGILLCCKDKKQYEEWLKNPKDYKFQHTDMYFIPFSKKDPNTPSFSKAISIYGRKYAYTEQDAWNGYYQDVLKALTTANSHVTKVLDEFFTKEHS